jgi:hypothetical protein
MSIVATDYTISINGQDLSTSLKQIEFSESTAALEDTGMGVTTKSNAVGLDEWTMTCTFLQGYGALGVDATIAAVRAGRAAVALIAKPTSGAISATNPAYTGNGICTAYNPIAATVGEVVLAQVTFACDGSLTRDTTP